MKIFPWRGNSPVDKPRITAMRRSERLAIGLGLVIAAALVAGFAVFWAQDACLDAGGGVRMATRQCEVAAGQYVPLFRERSLHGWAHDGVVALLAASLAIALFLRLSRSPSGRPSP